jgi:hypothetical protein
MGRLGLAFRSFLAVLRSKEKGQKVQDILTGAPSEGIQLLSILQRDGRLVDFLREDISRYSDSQIGAAVRTVHTGCRKALEETLSLEPIQKEPEGASVIIEKGFDPSTVRLTGHVFGDPPFTGTLKHHGWKAVETRFPKVPKGQNPMVIAPAEVEIARPPEES